jgi:hypothetical protein
MKQIKKNFDCVQMKKMKFKKEFEIPPLNML